MGLFAKAYNSTLWVGIKIWKCIFGGPYLRVCNHQQGTVGSLSLEDELRRAKELEQIKEALRDVEEALKTAKTEADHAIQARDTAHQHAETAEEANRILAADLADIRRQLKEEKSKQLAGPSRYSDADVEKILEDKKRVIDVATKQDEEVKGLRTEIEKLGEKLHSLASKQPEDQGGKTYTEVEMQMVLGDKRNALNAAKMQQDNVARLNGEIAGLSKRLDSMVAK